MAIIYNFLDYKDPKRKVKLLLVLGWICAFLSLLSFLSWKFIFIFGLSAIGFGIFSNIKCSRSGRRLIFASTVIMLFAACGNFFITESVKAIVNVFFLTG